MAARRKPEDEVVEDAKRQLLALGYQPDDFRERFPIQQGSRRLEVDLAVFRREVTGVRYQRKHLAMIIECKRRGTSDHAMARAQEQLESYLGFCISAVYGVVTRQDTWIVLEKRRSKTAAGEPGHWHFASQPDGPIPPPEHLDGPPPDTIVFGGKPSPTRVEAPAPDVAPPLLAVRHGERWYAVVETPFIIGRDPTADLPIDDPDISLRHASVLFEQGKHHIVDTGSRKGVRYNGKRIERWPIEEGDAFRLAGHEVHFTYRGKHKLDWAGLAALLRLSKVAQ